VFSGQTGSPKTPKRDDDGNIDYSPNPPQAYVDAAKTFEGTGLEVLNLHQPQALQGVLRSFMPSVASFVNDQNRDRRAYEDSDYTATRYSMDGMTDPRRYVTRESRHRNATTELSRHFAPYKTERDKLRREDQTDGTLSKRAKREEQGPKEAAYMAARPDYAAYDIALGSMIETMGSSKTKIKAARTLVDTVPASDKLLLRSIIREEWAKRTEAQKNMLNALPDLDAAAGSKLVRIARGEGGR
jgi:hypothetical protein